MPHCLWRGLEANFGAAGSTAFYDVKCDPGFHCVSKISDFGQNHDGNFSEKEVGKEAISIRYNGAYEVGCPARGFSFRTGECSDIGQGAKYHCWSSNRFEAGEDQPCGAEDSGKCLCVKSVSNDGDPMNKEAPKQASEVKQGEDLTTATWQVETGKQLKCRQCSQHDQSQEDCISCAPKCDYGTKNLAGLRITGCFDAEKRAFDKKAAEEQAQERLKEATATAPKGEAAVKKALKDYESKEVPETESKQLSIVPHYRIWNPKEREDVGDLKSPKAESGGYFKGQKLPWETSQRYLSARAWIKEFPHAAPQIQHLLDKVFQTLAGKADLSQIPCDGQGTGGGMGQLIVGTETAQKSCNDMQQTAETLAKEIKFENEANGQMVHCVMGDGGRCERLNCYTGNEEITRALDKLKVRQQKMCKAVDEMLSQEEKANGEPPPFEGGSLRAKAGALSSAEVADEVSPAQHCMSFVAPSWRFKEASQCRQRRRRADCADFLAV